MSRTFCLPFLFQYACHQNLFSRFDVFNACSASPDRFCDPVSRHRFFSRVFSVSSSTLTTGCLNHSFSQTRFAKGHRRLPEIPVGGATRHRQASSGFRQQSRVICPCAVSLQPVFRVGPAAFFLRPGRVRDIGYRHDRLSGRKHARMCRVRFYPVVFLCK